MNGFKRLIHEAHRRSLWQVIGIYCLGSWLAYEVILGIQEGVGLPEWVPGMAVVLFLIGLPIVVATAFVQEGAPGVRPPPPPDPVPASPADAPGSGFARHLTWRRALTGGVLAFAALALVTGAFLGMRSMGVGPVGTLVAKGVLEEREPVVLSDFQNTTADGSLGSVITDALRIDLLESTMVRVVDPANVDDVLGRMGRPAEEALAPNLAREVALRGGWTAVLQGDVAPVGSGYLLTASIVSAADGAVLAGFRRQARSSDELLAAIDALSKDIRAKVGESLRSVQAGEPLEQVSTGSLPALRTYSQALRLEYTEPLRAMQLLEEAIELDPDFAMAHRKLAVMLSNAGMRPRRRIEAATRAWELRDRLNERERGHAVAYYHLNVSGDDAAAIAAYRTLLDRYPDDSTALNNLALALNRSRRYADAEAVLERIAGELQPVHAHNLMEARFAQGDTAGAAAVLERTGSQRAGDLPLRVPYEALLAAATGDLDRASATADSALATTGDFVTRMRFTELAASLAVARGRLTRARELARGAAAAMDARGLGSPTLEVAAIWSIFLSEVMRDTAAALVELDRALERHPLDALDPYDRPYLQLAVALAKAGAPERAAALLDRYEAEIPSEHRGSDASELRAARGVTALHAADPAEAVRLLDAATRELACALCYLPELGRAHAALGAADSAIAAHERFLESPALFRYPAAGHQTGRVLEDLATLYEAVGRTEDAARAWSDLLELWKDADPALRPRVEDVRGRLQRLVVREG